MTLLEKMGIDLTTAEGLKRLMLLSCADMPCYEQCNHLGCAEHDFTLCKARHLFEEIPEIDWTKVPVDTKVLVWDISGEIKSRRYFSQYEDGMFYCYTAGATSWSCTDLTNWDHCELAEPIKEEWLKEK